MAELRKGIYGDYYGSTIGNSSSLTQAQMEVNARYIFSFLSDKGWSINAIAGIIGNMQHESALNPGRWQSENIGSSSGGFGLVQWTPSTNHTTWASNNGYSDYTTMDSNLNHIIYELENGIQYYATSSYLESFREFSVSTKTPYYLACAFAWNYERSYVVLYGTPSEQEALRQKRGGSANSWYEFLTGEEPSEPDDPINPIDPNKKRKKYNFILFNANKRRITNG